MIRSFVFSQSQGKLLSQDISIDLLRVFMADEGVQFWVDAGEVSDDEAKQLLDGVFHFHPLAIEDCLTPSDGPKVEEYEGYVFMVIHGVDFTSHEFRTKEMNLFIGRNFLVTFHREPMRSVDATIDRIQKNAPAVARAPDRLTYTLLDFLLENYNPALEKLAGYISELEEKVLDGSDGENIVAEVTKLKAEVRHLRQIAAPQLQVISRLAHGEFKIVRQHLLPYFRDLLDQLVRINTLTDNYRDSLTNTLQVHLNLHQVKVNQIIKVLTVMATLSMPALIVTSFYGMNFRHWPDSDAVFAYRWVFGFTATITVALYLFMKRKGWW